MSASMVGIGSTADAKARAAVTAARGAPVRWYVPPLSMLPLSQRRCLVRNTLTGAVAETSADEHAILAACSGCATVDEHEECAAAHFRVPPSDRGAIRSALGRGCATGLLMPLDALTARFAPAPEPAPVAGIVVRTADRPRLLARLLASAERLEQRTGRRHRWHVLDDSRDPMQRAANVEAVTARPALEASHHDLWASPLVDALAAAFPDATREIGWLVGGRPATAATYGRPLNHALLRFAGRRFLSVDDDALLDALAPPLAGTGFDVSGLPDELFAYDDFAACRAACGEAAVDPLGEHERWLGLPLATAWPLAAGAGGAPHAIAIGAGDAPRFAPAARILFTQNHAAGDPGSSLFPYHLLSLLPASQRQVADPARAFGARCNWRGVGRLRLAPQRALTLTTLAGIDNRELLPPTVREARNEDLLLGAMGQLVQPGGWYVDLPFALPHLRDPAKHWLGPEAAFPQEPVHFLLDLLDDRLGAIAASAPADRMASIAGRLRDAARAGDEWIAAALLQQAVDVATRVRFAIEERLEDPATSAAWREALAPWLRSPTLAVDGPALRARLVRPEAARALLSGYAAALDVWPALWNWCRERNR